MVIVSSCQNSHASLLHCFWQLRNVITVHNEEWNQLDHHHASKIELAPLKVSLSGFFPAFLNVNTIFCQGWRMSSFRTTVHPLTPPHNSLVKNAWKSLNNQQRSVTCTACAKPIRKKWLNKGDWSVIEIKMRCWEKPINATPSHNVQLELILGERHCLSVESICKSFRLHIHPASDMTEEIRDRHNAGRVGGWGCHANDFCFCTVLFLSEF